MRARSPTCDPPRAVYRLRRFSRILSIVYGLLVVRMSLPKVSVVQYLNTAPLVWGMLKGEQQGKYDLSFTTTSFCADAVRQKTVDIGIIPSIEYQRLEKAQILAGISIAAKNEVKSVLLLSKVPISQIKS